MKKIAVFLVAMASLNASAFQLQSERELGRDEAKNQNVVVKCTTANGKISDQTCHLRRFAKCQNKKCSGWQGWQDLRSPGRSYPDWRAAATACCATKGLR